MYPICYQIHVLLQWAASNAVNYTQLKLNFPDIQGDIMILHKMNHIAIDDSSGVKCRRNGAKYCIRTFLNWNIYTHMYMYAYKYMHICK